MALPHDWNDIPPGGKNKLKEHDQEILKQVNLVSFSVDPASIERFKEAVVHWDVEGPKSQYSLTLNGTPVNPSGSKTVKPYNTASYKLTAHGVVLSKQLGQRVLTVDDSQCHTLEFSASMVKGKIEDAVKQRFAGNNQIKLHSGSPSASMDQNGIHVKIASTINIPHWFDADMDIDMDFQVFAQISEGRARVILAKDNVDVSWSLLEHAASLGCTGVVQGALEKLMKVCINDLLKPYLENDFANELQEPINEILNLWQAADPEKRRFKLFSITTSETQMTIVGCPLDTAQQHILAADLAQPQTEAVLLE
jgi:hypothetical protein